MKDGKVYFENTVENLRGVFESLAHKHPLTSVRFRRVKGDMVSFEMDAEDKPGFDFAVLAEDRRDPHRADRPALHGV